MQAGGEVRQGAVVRCGWCKKDYWQQRGGSLLRHGDEVSVICGECAAQIDADIDSGKRSEAVFEVFDADEEFECSEEWDREQELPVVAADERN